MTQHTKEERYMKGLTRRARGFTAATAAGLAVLVAATPAHAQRPEKVGNGIPTGQMGVQMFNYGSYITNGASAGTPNPVTGVSGACATSTTVACRNERIEALFAFLQRKGVTNIELFGHTGFPSNTDTAGLQAYRALMDKYGLHAGGWHGTVTDVGTAWTQRIAAAKILGVDYIGSGGLASPGINNYNNTLLTAAALNRLGKESVEAGVGPVYIHNHQSEFTTTYSDGGVTKPAWQIVMERTDPRYVNAEIDVFWSSDALRDDTGAQTAGYINRFPDRVRLLHIKDGINIVPTAAGSPRATGTGELDFRPIFEAAKGRVQYYHQEHDSGTMADANTSFTNLKGVGTSVVATVMGYPANFAPVQVGTTAAQTVKPVKIENTGDAPLSISAVSIVADALDAGQEGDFKVVSEDCTTGGALVAGTLTSARGTCTVNVGFQPTKSSFTSVAQLKLTSNADDATERVWLSARSAADTTAPSVTLAGFAEGATFLQGDAATVTYTCTDNDTIASCIGTVPSGAALDTSTPGPHTFTVTGRDAAGNQTVVTRGYTVYPAVRQGTTAGGTVGATLSLTLGAPATFGVFTPGLARDYTASTTANVVSTAGDASLSIADPSSTATGHLVNGSFWLPQAVQVRAGASSFAPLGGTSNATALKTYGAPVSNDAVTIDFRQTIGAGDALRTGSYAKTVTLTLSTTTP